MSPVKYPKRYSTRFYISFLMLIQILPKAHTGLVDTRAWKISAEEGDTTMANNPLQQSPHDNKITVTLCVNNFAEKPDTYYGRIVRDKVTLENQLAHIAETNTAGINKFLMINSAGLLSTEITDAIKLAKAVEILDLGVLYVVPECNITGKNPKTSDITKFGLRFEPYKKLTDIVSGLSANQIVFSDGFPKIDTITNLNDGNTNNILKAGKPVSISGTKIKLFGNTAGIFLAPLDKDKKAVTDEKKWIPIPATSVFRNQPSLLEFIMPDGLEGGAKYRIVIRTSYTSGKTERKTPATLFSDVITIEMQFRV